MPLSWDSSLSSAGRRRPELPPIPPPGQRKVVVVDILENLQTATKGDATNWSYIELDLPGIEQWGPYLDSVTAHVNIVASSTNHQVKLAFRYSLDGKEWAPVTPIDLFSAITNGAGNSIQTPYTTTGNFGIHMRYMLALKNASGTAIESGIVSIKLAFTFQS